MNLIEKLKLHNAIEKYVTARNTLETKYDILKATQTDLNILKQDLMVLDELEAPVTELWKKYEPEMTPEQRERFTDLIRRHSNSQTGAQKHTEDIKPIPRPSSDEPKISAEDTIKQIKEDLLF